MIKLYGHPFSTCTRKVLMTLAETGTPFEMTVVDFATGEHKKEPHLSRQPFGRIPAIDDGGFHLYESRAIARYIAEKATSPLIPKDIQTRATMEQWISVETSEFSGHAMKFIYEHIFKRPQDAAVLESAGKSLATTTQVMAKQLDKQPFIAGADFTIADIGYMPYIDYMMKSPAKDIIEKHASVASWWKRISERPTWKKASEGSR
jgi:glutathione S-transferase